MDIDDLVRKLHELHKKRIGSEIEAYRKENMNEYFVTPDVRVVTNFREEVLAAYHEFEYPEKYINEIDTNRVSWDTTVALTIQNKVMGDQAKIIISTNKWRGDTMYHELTHVSDYYSYCERYGYLDMSYLEFIKLEDFQSIYLMSEFRAFYRCALKDYENLKKRIEFETSIFEKVQRYAIEKQQLETYYYHSIKYIGFLCAYYEKFLTESEINDLLNACDVNIIHKLFKFMYPLRKKDFQELEKHYKTLKDTLSEFISY